MRERQAQLFGPGGGRRDDDGDVIVADQAGTTSRPPRVQRRQPLWLNKCTTSRTVSSSAATSCAIAGTGVPDAQDYGMSADPVNVCGQRTSLVEACLAAARRGRPARRHGELGPPATAIASGRGTGLACLR